MTDKERILSLLNEFANPKKWLLFLNKATSSSLLIRPSANQINEDGFGEMILVDVIQEKAEITKIHRLDFLSENINFR